MNTVNQNKKEIKYLTYEDAKKRHNDIGGLHVFEMKEIHRSNYNYNDLMNISGKTSETLFKEVLKIEDDAFLKIILDFAGLVDTNEKYVIINTLLSIINADIYLSSTPNDIIDSKVKQHILKDTLKVFNSIENSNDVLKSLVNEYKTLNYLSLIFLNEKELYEALLDNKEFMKQSKNYNEVLDMFPQLKDNQR